MSNKLLTNEPLQPWSRLDTRTVFKDRWIELAAERYQTGAGAIIEPYYVVRRADWACILALDEQDNAIAVRMWRQPIGIESLELPAGAIDAADHDPAAAVRRELLEETGYACGDVIPVARLAVNPANHTNYMHVFAARGAHRVQAPVLEPGETQETLLMPVEALRAAALSGRMVHSPQVAAVLLACNRLGL